MRFERGLQSASPRFPKIWMLIAGFTLWYVWKACCLKVFQDLVRARGSDHGHMVHTYQLPTRAIGRGLQPLQRRGHCLFALLAEMAEHAVVKIFGNDVKITWNGQNRANDPSKTKYENDNKM